MKPKQPVKKRNEKNLDVKKWFQKAKMGLGCLGRAWKVGQID